jgi:putative endonuclease
MEEHKQATASQFTAKYRITQLVYVEETTDVHAALAREKQIKGWTRAKNLVLIEEVNPEWNDLSIYW